MKKTEFRKTAKSAVSILVLISVALASVSAAFGAETSDIIYIDSAKDFEALAEKCASGQWSEGKKVVLRKDISLADSESVTVPSFSGTFEGGGHTISGLKITGNLMPAGLFEIVEESGIICNLEVRGQVTPGGKAGEIGGIAGENNGKIENCTFTGEIIGKDSVGGIAGLNGETGVIAECAAAGSVKGKQMTGGIAGCNKGIISQCYNSAYINTESEDLPINPEDIDMDFSPDVSKVSYGQSETGSSDTGGIAGYSSGTISGCTNNSPVGYNHIGYNVGGIAGRSCGYINSCRNDASVFGRKDVGGIAGQMEPNIIQNISISDISILQSQLAVLNSMVEEVSAKADSQIGTVAYRLNAIAQYAEGAADAAAVPEPGEIEKPELEDLKDMEKPSDELNLKELAADIYGMTGQMKMLSREIYAMQGDMSQDIRAINAQINAVSETAIRIISENGTEKAIIDSSESKAEAATLGKIKDSLNKGRIDGDVNVGGIAGIMAIENEADPEEDFLDEADKGNESTLEVQAIVKDCINDGKVFSKRSYAGGICGRMNMGVIISSESYGNVSAENGNYVGGIAGITSSKVKECFSKCTLSGEKYVGGIVGAGVDKDVSGETSLVCGCFSMVSIEDCQQFSGAISGSEAGSFDGNIFVSDSLEGINRRSYRKKAEKVSFEELLKIKDEGAVLFPERFLKLTLSFEADGEVIKSVDFKYGETFSEEVFPEIPEKKGFYGRWDKEKLRNLCFDTTVKAVYEPYVSALSGEPQRSDDRPVFFVEGNFNEQDEIIVQEIYAAQDTGKNQQKKVIEKWKISIPGDEEEEHIIRYLPAAEDIESLKIYISRGEENEEVKTDCIGSYLTFSAEGNELEITVVSETGRYRIWVAAGVAAAAVLIVIVKKKCGNKTASGKKENCRRSKNKAVIAAVILAAAAVLESAVIYFVLPDFADEIRVCNILRECVSRQESVMELSGEGSVGDKNIAFGATIEKSIVEGRQVTTVSQGGGALYYCEGAIFMENGKAYRLNEKLPDYSDMPGTMVSICRHAEVTREKGAYIVIAEEAEAKTLTELLIPLESDMLPEMNYIRLEITCSGDKAVKIGILGKGNLTDKEKTSFSVSADLDLETDASDQLSIPEPVRSAIIKGDYATAEGIPSHIENLIRAWQDLHYRETAGANLEIKASCGPVIVDETCNLYRWNCRGEQIYSLTKGNLSMYFSDGAGCGKGGEPLADGDMSAYQTARLAETAYRICLNSEPQYEKTAQGYLYSFFTDQQGMRDIACAIAPAAEGGEMDFDKGHIEILVNDDKIQNITFCCSGKTKVLDSYIDMKFEADMTLMETGVETIIPDAVKDALDN